MHAESTVFFDVCLQRDLGSGGAWPILSPGHAQRAGELFACAARWRIRQGGIVCVHDGRATGPPHALAGSAGGERLDGCVPVLPAVTVDVWCDQLDTPVDRSHAFYLATGCAGAPDETPLERRVFEHLIAGIRDAVVFGAGIEYAMARAIDALLRRRVRTHVALDATGSADPAEGQRIIADWKRRMVDVTTAAMVIRLLERGANDQV